MGKIKHEQLKKQPFSSDHHVILSNEPEQMIQRAPVQSSLYQRAQSDSHSLSSTEMLFLQRTLGNRAVAQLFQRTDQKEDTLQKVVEPSRLRKNNTGLPDTLKAGVENLSGLSLDDVHVHYNSSQPAQLNALAYTQGRDIHVAPGQERHLPHEAWHVVQQAQGRVKPTMQMKGGVPVNDDEGLEHEAGVMGAKAVTGMNSLDPESSSVNPNGRPDSFNVVQRQPGGAPVAPPVVAGPPVGPGVAPVAPPVVAAPVVPPVVAAPPVGPGAAPVPFPVVALMPVFMGRNTLRLVPNEVSLRLLIIQQAVVCNQITRYDLDNEDARTHKLMSLRVLTHHIDADLHEVHNLMPGIPDLIFTIGYSNSRHNQLLATVVENLNTCVELLNESYHVVYPPAAEAAHGVALQHTVIIANNRYNTRDALIDAIEERTGDRISIGQAVNRMDTNNNVNNNANLKRSIGGVPDEQTLLLRAAFHCSFGMGINGCALFFTGEGADITIVGIGHHVQNNNKKYDIIWSSEGYPRGKFEFPGA